MLRSDPAWLNEFERDLRGGGRVGGGGFTRVLLVLEDLFDKEDGVGEANGLELLWIGGCDGDQGALAEGVRG